MRDRRNILLASTAVMVVVAVVIAASAITVQYRWGLQHHRDALVQIAQVQARLMEAVGRFDAQFSKEDDPGGSRGATLSQIVEAQRELAGFGETGEFVIGERAGENIVFLAPIRDGIAPASVGWSSTDAEPMRLALEGESGTVRAMDYDGVPVLAAYEPVMGLGLGVVAKRDVAEIQASIMQAALFSGLAALLVIGLGAFIMHRAISPVFQRLEESEGRTRVIVETATEAIITIGERGIIESFNPQAEVIFGYLAQEVLGQNISMLMDTPRREEHDGYLERYLQTGEAQILGRIREVEGLRKDGTHFALELKANEMWLGGRRLFTGFVQDISERKKAEQSLRQSENRYRSIFEGAPVSIWEEEFSEVMDVMEDLRGKGVIDFGAYLEDHPEFVEQASRLVKVLDVNAASVKMFQASSKEELLGSLDKTFTEDSLKVFRKELIAIWEGNDHFRSEAAVKTLGGGVLNVIVHLRISYHGPSRYRAWVSLVDITERKRVEVRQRRMMDELDHRVKNNLAAVISLTQQTARGMNFMDDFLNRLTGRLMSMARTHESLAAARWEGVYLEELVVGNVNPFADGRLDTQGERVLMPARTAGPTSMTLHELATNAVKYGSLSYPEGRVMVRWFQTESQIIQIHWEERGGPVVRKPDHAGLGTSLIQGFIQHELGGKVDLDFRASGLVATLQIPLTRETVYNSENSLPVAPSPQVESRS